MDMFRCIGREMSQSYNKPCRDCKQQIRMAEVNGKWGAYQLDGSYHQCLNTAGTGGSKGKEARD